MVTAKKLINSGELQNTLRTLLGHNLVAVRAHGRNLLIELLIAKDTSEIIARLTEIGPNSYVASFRSHTGRWEKLPGEGSLTDMAKLIVDNLGAYLDPGNY